MERKTQVQAEDGKQVVVVTREFDLPVDLLFRAHVEPEIVAEWMGTQVLKLDSHAHGGWQFETRDAQGNVVFQAHGVIHACVPNQKIIRTFEMDNRETQLEFFEFEKLSDTTSRLTLEIVFRSLEAREQQLKLPFAYGLNWAHNQLQACLEKHLQP
ncbi:MAG: SRPBCC family protein [Candidatus Sericytochromatia bacterium]